MANIIIVNDHNEVIGESDLKSAIDKEQIRRIVRVFLINKQGKLLIQQRSSKKWLLPNAWENSVTGHVDTNETNSKAAIRELQEELGIKNCLLQEKLTIYREELFNQKKLKRFEVIFVGYYDGEVKIDKNEVACIKWVFPKTIKELINKKENDFSYGFREAFKDLWQK